MKSMLDAGTTVAILMLLFIGTITIGLAVPEARDAVSGRLAGWADAAFSALLVALGAVVERARARGHRPAPSAGEADTPTPGGPARPSDGGDDGAA